MSKVSFIIAAYNVEKYIEKCLKSIKNQSLKDIEIIVVDDGSEDNTSNIIKGFSSDDNRIKYIYQDNKGIIGARITGLEAARGEYVVFIDGDDWVNEKLAENMYKVACKNNVDIVCYELSLVYDNGNFIEEKNKIYNDINSKKYLELILRQKIRHNLVNKFIRRSFINKTSFREICRVSMAEDLVSNIILGINEPNVIMTNEVMYYYYQRSNSTMNKSSEKLLEIVDVLEYIEDEFKKNNIYDKYKKEIEYLWFRHCYMYKVVNAMTKVDKYHKQLYYKWKSKNISIKGNRYCKEYMNLLMINRKILKKIFDFNYNLGAVILKVEHKLRGVKY